jgi:uncharacterized protein (TIGR02246 family)
MGFRSSVLLIVVSVVSMCCRPAPERRLTNDDQRAIADEVGQLFNQIPEATHALEFERLLSFYREGDDLTYVARGRLARSFEAFSDVMDEQFDGVTEANLTWIETYVDVLSRDVAVATAKFEFTAGFEDGNIAQSDGTYTAVYVQRDGRWGIEYSAHTFPPRAR